MLLKPAAKIKQERRKVYARFSKVHKRAAVLPSGESPDGVLNCSVTSSPYQDHTTKDDGRAQLAARAHGAIDPSSAAASV
jgi:hypothetical protein